MGGRRSDRDELTGDALLEAVRGFIEQARSAERILREFMVASGMEPVDRTLAHSWHGLVDQLGTLPGAGRYYFHGIGCVVTLPASSVDVDWTPEGDMVVDAFKIERWLEAFQLRSAGAKAIADAMRVLSRSGELLEGDWWSHFVVPRGR